ncbi:MAG: MotA/TolQ/ExbB proton channel family protein [Planctomycetes bacterium]|nr:MotA/TolQ/ExbB proton channel family protein [Planctomycetota bacterium]
MKQTLRIACFLLASGLLAAPLLAQAGPAASAPASPTSISGVIWAGMEWPAYFILVGSLVMIALVVEHFISIRTVTIAPPDQVKRARDLIERRAFRECLDAMKKSGTFFARTMSAWLQHARHGFEAMHEAAIEKSGELSGQMFRKVEYMNIIGNLGPLMGLLGTVFGMIIAFNELGHGGGEAAADAGGLARGISLALVNTLLGLGLAIVGLLFFGICRNRIESLTVRATVQTLDLLEYFRPVAAASHAAASEPRRPASPAPAGASESL